MSNIQQVVVHFKKKLLYNISWTAQVRPYKCNLNTSIDRMEKTEVQITEAPLIY